MDGVRQEAPWTMVFADDIVMCGDSMEQNSTLQHNLFVSHNLVK